MEPEKRALVVDDDPAACELIRDVLSGAGLQVAAQANGEAALELLRTEKFAVLLFDLRMPQPDGIALARLARAPGLNKMTPIILLSDDQSTAAVSEGFAAGASFFLYKPIDIGSGGFAHDLSRIHRKACSINPKAMRASCSSTHTPGM